MCLGRNDKRSGEVGKKVTSLTSLQETKEKYLFTGENIYMLGHRWGRNERENLVRLLYALPMRSVFFISSVSKREIVEKVCNEDNVLLGFI
jgi:hypothetical protein